MMAKSPRFGIYADGVDGSPAIANYALCAGTVERTSGAIRNDGIYSKEVVSRASMILDGLSQTMLVGEVRTLAPLDRQTNPTLEGTIIQIISGDASPGILESACPNAAASAQPSEISPVVGSWMKGKITFSTFMPPGTHGCELHQPFGNGFNVHFRAIAAGVLHGSVTNVGFADGSVRPVSRNVDMAVWRALGTMARGDIASGQ